MSSLNDIDLSIKWHYQCTYLNIKTGHTTLAAAAAKNQLSKRGLKRIFENYGWDPLELKPGRPKITVTDEQVESIKNYAIDFHVGYERCAQALTKRGFPITFAQAKQVYNQFDLYLYKKKNKTTINMLIPH